MGTKFWLLILLILTVQTSSAYVFIPGEYKLLDFTDAECSEIEILRYEDQVISSEESLNYKGERYEETKTSQEYEIITIDPFNEKQTANQYIYKESPLKVLGLTRKTCPAKFLVTAEGESGYYYAPIILYDSKGNEKIIYFGFEIIEEVPSVVRSPDNREGGGVVRPPDNTEGVKLEYVIGSLVAGIIAGLIIGVIKRK